MQRGSDKHGFRLDDQLDRETRGIVQGGHDPRSEEWKTSEPPGEDQPEVDRAPHATLHGGVPEGLTDDDVEGRAEFAALLGKEIWPAETEQIRQRLPEQHAPDWAVALAAQLPDGRIYANVGEVWEDLTGAREKHRF
jgi:hypothetical protein